jgi:hypothetical protein
MNNLTRRFLVFLFVMTSVFAWANNSPKAKEKSASKKTINAPLPPAPPSVVYVGIDRCGYQAAGDPRSIVQLRSNGCANGFIQWYDSNGNNLGRNINFTDQKFLEVTQDVTVYATCTEFNEESTPSNSLFIKYLSVPPVQPFITQSDTVVCKGQVVTLKSSLNDPKYVYRWERSKGIEDRQTFGSLIDTTTSGQGSPTLKVKLPGYYYLTVISNECPNVTVFGKGQIKLNVYASPKPVITASDSIFCENKSVSLKADSSAFVSSYEWYVNGKKQDSLGVKSFIKSFNKSAKIQVLTRESRLGCTSPLSTPVTLKTLTVPAKPTITPSKRGAAICKGDTLALSSSLAFKYKWSNGAITQTIKNISAVGKYAVQVIDTSGCVSLTSDTTTITVFNLPAKPAITANGPIAFCLGGSVDLTSTPNTTYLWSTNETTRTIKVSTSSNITVAVRDVNNCLSPTSDLLKVTVYDLPAKPTILVTGSLSFCADKSVILTSSDLINGEKTRYKWNSSDTTKSINVKSSNTFTVQVIDPRNCVSPASNAITTVALPLPVAPSISLQSGSLIFCSRSNDDYSKINTVTLKAVTVVTDNKVTWDNGVEGSTLTISPFNDKGVFLDISRDYTASATNIATGCVSPRSNALTIIVKNNPDASASKIDKDGTFTLKAVDFPAGNGEFEWRRGTTVLPFKEAIIKANVYGEYVARKKVFFAVPTFPGGQLGCFSDFVKPFAFNEDPDFKGLSVYPNPSNGYLTIETLKDYNNVQILIYDLLGREIYTGTVATINGKLIVDLRNQVEGEYMLRFKAEDFDLTKRIIVNR